ncbi:MAG: PDZ domain-containing protein, partial [Deltaproteobacteria bacterium]|nr:PDZ domain-containing protein [Deltaproteobacteria bacterium]
ARALRELGIEGGVEVDFVDASGAAWQGGIREGDVLLRINREPVPGLDAYRRAMTGVSRGSMASVLLLRDGSQMYVAFRVR